MRLNSTNNVHGFMTSILYYDCEYLGKDPHTGKFVVKEQLYPEARGWREHEFESEAEALAWLESLPRSQ